ncbi:hydrogenase expression/formation protein [bacterium I07]|nr:hydrogenase expression/formation protein [bacterium I07]
MNDFPAGKLPSQLLNKLLSSIHIEDPRIIVGPRLGEDAAVLDMGDRYLVVKSDPVTFTAKRIGWYAVHVNANDVATMGAAPRWFFATLLLPEGRTDACMVERIFEDIRLSCESLNVTLCGGHTEITAGLDRPILSGHMLGEVEKDNLVTAENIAIGDRVLLTQGIAIEGISILAEEKAHELSGRIGSDMIKRAKAFIDNPGISVTNAAMTANSVSHIHGMHDPTEGGLATGLWELAQASRLGLRIEKDKVPVFPETLAICDALGIDPWGTLASGALLIVAEPDESPAVQDALVKQNIPCTDIGCIVPESEGIKMVTQNQTTDINPYQSDEITRVL